MISDIEKRDIMYMKLEKKRIWWKNDWWTRESRLKEAQQRTECAGMYLNDYEGKKRKEHVCILYVQSIKTNERRRND